MQSLLNKLKKHYQTILLIIIMPFVIPLINIIIKILFSGGCCLGTLIRRFSEGVIC